MPANFCLLPETVTKFKQALKDGTIQPEKLADMSSAERREFFEGIVGKNHAKAVNAEFESKILLKNQKQGYINWAKKVSGITPATRRDLVKRIENMNTVLDPEEGKQFMSDLTARRLGIDVTEEEAKDIANLSKKVTDLESLRKADGTFPSEEDRLNYGRSVEDLTDYVAGLKQETDKINFRAIREADAAGKVGLIGKFTNKTAGNLKSLQASLDNSAVFRQGWKVMFTDPKIWAKNSADTFRTIAQTMGGKNVLREVNADIISRPNYDRMVKAKLAIKDPEEAFPESLAEKIPYARRLYKSSEAAFTAFQYKNRADVFDKYLQIAKEGGVDINDKKQLEAIGKLVNSLTGRGNLGKLEPIASGVNNFFFSPRFVKANWDTITAHTLDKSMTPFARKKAATNLAKVVAGTAGVLATANALLPGSVEFDPKSSDFGKIRIGDTRFDVTGGMGSILTLAARIASGSTKSTSGVITMLNTGEYGSKTTWDQIMSFVLNKASPALNLGYKLGTGTDSRGEKVDRGQAALESIAPIGVQTGRETLSNPNAAPFLLTMIADGLGIGANTYSASGDGNKTSWEGSGNKDLKEFRSKVGDKEFQKAARTFDTSYNAWINEVVKNDRYKKLSDDDKKSLMTKKKTSLKKSIFGLYQFKPTKDSRKQSDTEKDLLK
jgi:hypothetical protein